MKDKWGKTPMESAIRALEVWEPIVAWCKGHNMKAWVKQPNEYTAWLRICFNELMNYRNKSTIYEKISLKSKA